MSVASLPAHGQPISGYVSLEAGAAYYDISTRTLRRAIAEGRVPAVKVGRQIRIAWADLDALARPIPAAGNARHAI